MSHPHVPQKDQSRRRSRLYAVGGNGVGESTWNLPDNFQPLKVGDRGPAVSDLQQNLIAWGFAPGKVDGIYGPKTQAAVTALQNKIGATPTGNLDEETGGFINADLQSGDSILRGPPTSQPSAMVPASGDASAPAPAPATHGMPTWAWIALGVLGLGTLALLFSAEGSDDLHGTDDFGHPDEPNYLDLMDDEFEQSRPKRKPRKVRKKKEVVQVSE